MRYFLLFSVIIWLGCTTIGSGCGNSSRTVVMVDSTSVFRRKISILPIVKAPMEWEVEGVFEFTNDHTVLGDSLGFEKHEHVLGLLEETSSFYTVLYLASGDALYPSVRIFKKNGEKVVDHVLAFVDCAGADCSMQDCNSYVRLDGNGLSRGITYEEVECDTMALKNFVKHFERIESIRFDSLGNMITHELIE